MPLNNARPRNAGHTFIMRSSCLLLALALNATSGALVNKGKMDFATLRGHVRWQVAVPRLGRVGRGD